MVSARARVMAGLRAQVRRVEPTPMTRGRRPELGPSHVCGLVAMGRPCGSPRRDIPGECSRISSGGQTRGGGIRSATCAEDRRAASGAGTYCWGAAGGMSSSNKTLKRRRQPEADLIVRPIRLPRDRLRAIPRDRHMLVEWVPPESVTWM